MKRLYHFLLLCAIIAGVVSCSKEDELTPSNLNEDYFSVPKNATDATSLLRKAFFEATGVHVLFNDTLRHEQQGTNPNGTPKYYTETIDLNWNVTNYVSSPYRWEYLNENDYREAADFCQNYLLPHLGGPLRPYSVFLVDKLEYDNYGNGRWTSVNYVNNYRCLAINAGAICGGASDAEKDAVFQDICKAIIKSKLSNDVLTEFAAISDKYYYYDFSDFYDDFSAFRSEYRNAQYDWWDADDAYAEAEEAYEAGEMSEEDWAEAKAAYAEAEAIWKEIDDAYVAHCYEIANECGFVSCYTYYGSFPNNASDDMTAFVDLIFNNTEEEVEEMYADYPKVIEKYQILKEIISEFGYVF